MKKIIFFSVIAFVSLSSCRKETATIAKDQTSEKNFMTSSEGQSSSGVADNTSQAIPIRGDIDLYFPAGVSDFNTCTREYINFSGSGHINIRGVINDNKITFIGHYDVHNVKGVGQLSGTRYVTTII